MALLIEDVNLEEKVRELAVATGEPLDVSVSIAVNERLDRVTGRNRLEILESIRQIQDRVAAMPVLDSRSAEEILEYGPGGYCEGSEDPTVEEIMELVRGFNIRPIDPNMTEDEIFGYGPDGFFES